MASDHNSTGDPKSDALRASGQLRSTRPIQDTLAWRLVPVADRIRALAASFGLRPYRVFLVHGFWSGERVGEGELLQNSRIEILPTPRVRSMESVRHVLRATGRSEEGDIFVDQISASYPETDLLGQTPDLVVPTNERTSPENAEFWWEVVEERPTSPRPTVRRFVPVSVPDLKRDMLQWSLSLTKQDYDPSAVGNSDGRVVSLDNC